MSVPPQHPGYDSQPGGWPQQSGQPGQSPGYGQQSGGFPQAGDESTQSAGFPHAGPPQQYGQFGQPGGFPPPPGQYGGLGGQFGQQTGWAPGQSGYSGGWEQAQPGQPAGWGQSPGQFGQPGPYGVPGQFAPYPNQFGEPPRKRRALPWVLAGGGVVVLAVIVILVVTLTGGGSPQSTAQAVVDRLNAKDVAGLQALSCKAQQGGSVSADDVDPMKDAPAEYRSMTAQWSLRGVQQKDDSHADAAINLSFGNIPAQLPASVRDRMAKGVDGTLALVKEDGDWKACDLKVAGGA
jgi:hypothetical protein